MSIILTNVLKDFTSRFFAVLETNELEKIGGRKIVL